MSSSLWSMDGSKRCPKCGVTKSVGEFFKNRARRDGLSGYCKPCQQEVNAANAARLKAEVIEILGGPICRRCEFDDPRALVIDHIDGGGNQHRIDAISMWGVYKHAKAHPEGYQVLCCNCNQIKRHENGEWGSKEYVAKVRANPRERFASPVKWARDYECCRGCGTTETKHHSKGLCKNCTMRLRRRGTTEPIEDLSAFRSKVMSERWAAGTAPQQMENDATL